MKFKITKSKLEFLLNYVNDSNITEIDLEPVIDTATQAIYEQQIKNEAFRKGIEYGYKEGFYEGRCPEKKPTYFYCNYF